MHLGGCPPALGGDAGRFLVAHAKRQTQPAGGCLEHDLVGQERLGQLVQLRVAEQAGPCEPAGDQPLRALIVFAPGEDPTARPMIDGQPVPVLTANQWAHAPRLWLDGLREKGAA